MNRARVPETTSREEPHIGFGTPPPPAPPPAEAFAALPASPSLAQRAVKGRQVRKRHDAHGHLIESYEIRDGLLHGVRRVWSPNGTLLVETRYREGRPHGTARSWNVHGQIISRIIYKDGKRSGPFTTWWDNGRIKEQGIYYNDRRVGWYVWFDSDGTQLGRYHYAEPVIRVGRRRRRRKHTGFLTRLTQALGL